MVVDAKNLRILSNHVDTLKVGFSLINIEDYIQKLTPYINMFEEKKNALREKEEYGAKLEKIELDGYKFMISSKASGKYRYYLECEDFMMLVGKFPFDYMLPHIVIHFRSHYLVARGVEKSFYDVREIVHKLFGETKNTIKEIHLAMDIQGIYYTLLDTLRFQTPLKQSVFADDYNNFYIRFKEIEGFQFGKGDFLIRIYNKTKQIRKETSASFIKAVWIKNLYNEEHEVWRHEIQLRRLHIQKLLPRNCRDEFEAIKIKLESFWFYGLKKIKFNTFTDEEVLGIEKGVSGDNYRKMAQRARERGDFNHFDLLKKWGDVEFYEPTVISKLKDAKEKTAAKQFKGAFSALFKARGSFEDAGKFVEEIDSNMIKNGGLGLFDSALLKTATSLLSKEYSEDVQRLIYLRNKDAFINALSTITDKEHRKTLDKVLAKYDNFIDDNNVHPAQYEPKTIETTFESDFDDE